MIVSSLLYKLYSINNLRIRNFVLSFVKKLEKGELFSTTLRNIFNDYHDISIGLYTFGGCFVPGQVSPYTTIGRFCSIAGNIRIINRYHPTKFKSTHAIFCVTDFGLCDKNYVDYTPITIGSDVWIGHNATILRNVKNVGHGAVIGAGAVVNKDIPPFAIVLGYPARIVQYRFSKPVIEELLASEWWESSLDDLKPNFSVFQKEYENDT